MSTFEEWTAAAMFKRRDVLQWAAGGAAVSLLGAAPAHAEEAAGGDPIQPFSNAFVVKTARELAEKPFSAPNADLPGPLGNLSYEAYIGIRATPEGMIWAKDSGGFVLEPLHRGFVFTAPMRINLVEDGLSRRLVYDAAHFAFGDIKMSAPPKDLDFSGFRVFRRGDDGALSELAIFQGASFFRSLAPGQNFGVTARGLSVHTGDPRGEEFPFFREIWIERPTRAANILVLHALLDSESLTGAYRFTLHPGDATIIDTECTLFPRADVDNIGLATMSATSLFTPLERRGADDFRGAAAEVSGLQMYTGAGEWVWRPVANRSKLQISEFVDQNPRGFGFLQRDRDFYDFNDDDQHWERRPSLWIEPIGDWGPGSVELLEIPSDSEPAQNIIAFWRCKQGFAKGQSYEFAYRQFWCWNPPTSPPNAVAESARSGRGASAKQRRFQVDFQADFLADAAKAADIKADLTTSPGRIASVRLFPAPEQKRLRVLFDLDPNGESACELRLALVSQGAPVSETWLYRWTS
jgi:glucans biosynthesis protein